MFYCSPIFSLPKSKDNYFDKNLPTGSEDGRNEVSSEDPVNVHTFLPTYVLKYLFSFLSWPVLVNLVKLQQSIFNYFIFVH